MQKPLPEDAEPRLSVVSIPVPPAPPEPRSTGAGHTHAGPVFAYILQGNIENQVEPDLPAVYKPGDFFYKAPGRVHRFLRNLSTTEPAKLIVFQSGATGTPAPVIRTLHQEPLLTTKNQEVSLLRLTLAPLSLSETPARSNPDVMSWKERSKLRARRIKQGPITPAICFSIPSTARGSRYNTPAVASLRSFSCITSAKSASKRRRQIRSFPGLQLRARQLRNRPQSDLGGVEAQPEIVVAISRIDIGRLMMLWVPAIAELRSALVFPDADRRC